MTYLDSRILVKLFVNESDSPQWQTKLAGVTNLASSALLLPEAPCALRQKAMGRLITGAGMSRIWTLIQQITFDGMIKVYPIGSDVIDASVQIINSLSKGIALRTLDAIHLATAQLIGASGVATTDARMRAAAIDLSIPLL